MNTFILHKNKHKRLGNHMLNKNWGLKKKVRDLDRLEEQANRNLLKVNQ